MPIDQPPAIMQPADAGSSRGWTGNVFNIETLQPSKIIISDLVEIDLKDGSMIFREGYEPTKAARAFWEAMSQEYRDMLKWKAEHGQPLR